MSKVSTKKAVVIALAAVQVFTLAGLAALYYVQKDSNKELLSALNNIGSSVQEIKSENLDEKIVKGIDNFISSKLKDSIEAKYAPFKSAQDEPVDGKWVYGNPNARFTLVEFSDYECPYCQRFHDTPKKLTDASKGNVNWEWKHLPLSFHNPAARMEAEAVECIAEQKGNKGFWVASQEVFNQTAGNGKGVPNITELAVSVGADADIFQACMNENKHSAKIDADLAFAAQNGITGTPATYIVDNHTGNTQLVRGAQPAEAITSVIQAMIANSEDKEAE